ncbi:MAG: tRNA (adenosine(37)-N6)-threonylcarbamoyltransferase complex transferase subunit TsaD [Cytophagales bacterium]|nr:tRNA (adenosine(37)-N6)-threonylcarbamoyltransferase complex transferase subunit TsaD [Cytophagales bacterium]
MGTILGIESSCDETSAAVCHNGKVINNIIATQSIHEQFGGVVPELASRAHQRNIIPVVYEALNTAKINASDLDGIAYTQGPGLLGALLVGSSFAKAMAFALDVPIISVNHMMAHVLAHFIDDPAPKFPFLCLTISGGHTQIVKVASHQEMSVIGQTRDDAAGEAFDKGAKLLGLPYPGGPMIDKHAKAGDPVRFKFAESDMPELDYSFSGIKTSLLYFLRDQLKTNGQFIEQNLDDLCASYQQTIINMLIKKLKKAVKETGIKEIAIAGGVSANQGLQQQLKIEAEGNNWQLYIPKLEYCTDNAAMIAISGYYKYIGGKFDSLRESPLPRMSF